MSIKQDRCKARTPMDLERRYKFGERMKENNLQIKQMEKKSKELNIDINKFIEDVNRRFEEVKTNGINGISVGAHIYSGVPTLSNMPASNWNDEDKKKHIGDMYCDINTGKIYVFNSSNGIYSWIDCTKDYYNKSEVDSLIPNLSNYYNKSDVDTKISDTAYGLQMLISNYSQDMINNYYNKEETNAQISNYNKNVETNILNNITSNDLILNNAKYLRGKSSTGEDIRVAGISSNNHVILGSGEGKAQNTHVYADYEVNFYAQRASSSYQAHVLKIQREQSGSNRTIFRCESNGEAYLGTSGYRFNTAYFTNAITASDLKEKEVIEDYDFKHKDFIMSLKPIAYRRVGNGDNGKRIHLGLGAQDVAKCIKDLDLGNLSLVQASILNDDGTESPYFGEDIEDDKLSWGINYTELLPEVILMLQDLYKNTQEKDKRIEELENKVEELIKGTK